MKMVLVDVNDVKNALHDAVDGTTLGYYAVERIRGEDIDKIVDRVPCILSDEAIHEIEEAINIFKKDIKCSETDASECLKNLICEECPNYVRSADILENAERIVIKYFEIINNGG